MRIIASLTAPLVCSALAGLLVAGGACGESGLSRAYRAYNPKVEALLDREIPLLKKTLDLLNDLRDHDKADPDRYEAVVTKEAVPFYDDLVAKVTALQPGDPGLDPAHETLVKYARTRAALAHHLAENLALSRPDAKDETLAQRTIAAQAAMEAYLKALGQGFPDNRFSELMALERRFAERVAKPLSEGTASGKDVEKAVMDEILPQVGAVLATKFGDDPESKLLNQAAATAKEFYQVFLDSLPLLEQRTGVYARTTRLVKEGDDHLKRFREAMDAVRRRM